jgi:hypothetical protein
MKNSLLGIIVLILLVSCVSLQDREMSSNDLQLKVLGEVKSEFTSFHFFHIQISPIIKKIAYDRLMDKAKEKYAASYGADVLDVKNIIIKYNYKRDNWFGEPPNFIFPGLIGIPIAIICDWQTLDLSGTVVINPNKSSRATRTNQNKPNVNIDSLEKAVEKIAETFVERLPRGSSIAVLSMSGTANAGQIIDELEFRLVEKGTDLKIVERRLLAQIRLEQGFQMTGDVSDESAVSIGYMLGANIVITGNVTNSGNKQRLTVKALDVKTAQIVTMARENF